MSHRAQILELRGQTDPATGRPYSMSKIATALGVSKSLVEKELHRTAREPIRENGGSLPAGGVETAPPGYYSGELAETRRGLENERLELMRIDVQAKRLEAQKRLELLQSGGRGDGAMTMILMEQIRDLRGMIERITAQARQPQAPPVREPSVTDKLSEWRQMGEIVQSFAPAKGPSTILELEAKAMLERINAEDRREQRKFDLEREERLERARGQARRDEAVAMSIEQTMPLIGQAINAWAANQSNGNGSQVGAIRPLITEGEPAAEAVGAGLRSGEVGGVCPSCQAQLAVTAQDPGSCPRCQTPLAVENGQIVSQAPAGIRRMQPVAS